MYYGAESLVLGATNISINLNISKAMVGVTLVAFGTSSPELFVNLVAAYRGHTEFALTNVAGSNLANLCIGFGTCALVGSLVVTRKEFCRDVAFLFLAPVAILFFLGVFPGGRLPLWSAVVLALLFVYYLASSRKRFRAEEINAVPRGRLRRGILLFLLGVAGLYAGGELVLKGALGIGETLGVSEAVLGLTVVAVGTSIPDITASIVATKRAENSIAVGNLLGSNIFNILLVLSGTLLMAREDLITNIGVTVDYGAVCICSLVFFLIVSLRERLHPAAGLLFILFYALYIFARVQTI